MAENEKALFTVGDFRRIYNPGTDENGSPWHINDHCFCYDNEGVWHMFGIAYPDPGYPTPLNVGFGHATANSLTDGDWDKQPFALPLDSLRGETVLWAPHVVTYRGLHYMFYCSGGADLTSWGISLATSSNLRNWTRHSDVLFRDGFQARDPVVIWDSLEQKWVMYYCATEYAEGGHYAVACRTSSDLVHWGPREIAYRDVHAGTEYGPTESPFVVRRGEYFYLFIGPRPYDAPTTEMPNWEHPGYDGTSVFRSKDSSRWTDEDYVGHIPAHALEVVRDIGGNWYVSHCGIKRGGLFLAPLYWNDGQDESDCSLFPGNRMP